jgi:DNA-binding transcriptional ArsR family regulator
MRDTPLSRGVDAFKALGHPARLRIVEMLGSGPLSVCQITAVLGGAPSTVSAHLSELSFAGLVEHERSGRFVTYRLAAGEADRVLHEARVLLGADEQVRQDDDHARRLRARGIRAVDWAEPCLEVEVGADVREPVMVPAGEGDGT